MLLEIASLHPSILKCFYGTREIKASQYYIILKLFLYSRTPKIGLTHITVFDLGKVVIMFL